MTRADRAAEQHRDHLFELARQDGFELDEFLDHFDPKDRQHEISAEADAGQCWDYTLRYELHHRQSLDCVVSETQAFTSTSTYGRVIDIGCGTGGASSYLASEQSSLIAGAEFYGFDHSHEMRRLYEFRGKSERWHGRAIDSLDMIEPAAKSTFVALAFVAGQPTFTEDDANTVTEALLNSSCSSLDVVLLTASGQVGKTGTVVECLSTIAHGVGRPFMATSGLMVCAPVFLDRYAPSQRLYRPTPPAPNLRWDLIRIGGR